MITRRKRTLLENGKEPIVHQRSLKVLIIVVYNTLDDYASITNFFVFRENSCNIRNFQVTCNKIIKTVRYDLEKYVIGHLFFGNIYLQTFKFAKSFSNFEDKIKI